MKYTIWQGDRPIILEHDNIEDTIDVDALTTIDTSNIFGEAVTISAATNRIGLLKAELESNFATIKLELKIFEGNFRGKLRKKAAENSGFFTLLIDDDEVKIKATEKALEYAHETDENWIKLKKDLIKTEKQLNQLGALYWAVQDKSRKLNGLVSGTTPEEFVAELIEGKINGILITKK